ncbi:FecCD family ABC transporter permease [Marinospirillum sp.]|uniref:FecCD family ABC transporter permease n=1 Tax=Marinospirillum sp. TaxID=2183934 RepID=UPI003A85780A
MMTPRFPLWSCGPITILAPSKAALHTTLFGFLGLLGCLLLSLTLGESGLSPARLLQALAGQAEAYEHWLLWQSRLPRALTALGAGAALGIAGAVFQSLSRNALGSPDIIGINAGASAGAVLCLLFLPSLPLAWGALCGTLLVLVLLLPGLGNRGEFSNRLIVMGIAVNALAIAIIQFTLTLVQREQAQQLLGYLSGSLAHRDWQQVSWIALTLAVAVPGLLLLSRRLNLLTLGPETSISLGLPLRQTQLTAILFASLLALGAVLCAGPVSFIALVAPHLARWKNQQLALLRSGVIGALLLLGADTLTLLLPGQQRLPVGVLTAMLGGSYLTLLLLGQMFKRKPSSLTH